MIKIRVVTKLGSGTHVIEVETELETELEYLSDKLILLEAVLKGNEHKVKEQD